jgi:multiple sugar transport system ATP-binding protein
LARLTFDGVVKVYSDGTRAVESLTLEAADGELVVLVGPSGCGKTTALRMVAGLEDITAGAILIDDRVINDVEPRTRDVAMVFQNYALYPNMSVAENIGFPLRVGGVPRRERDERVRAVARTLGLEEHLRRKPRHLSGGQRQRVAMGRAIIRQPRVFLMDEPLSNLDAKLRVQMRAEISKIQRRLGVTTLYVTHDQVEAMTVGDRVAVMRHGVLQQYDTPEQVYSRPANLFVASFVGSPPMNLVEGLLSESDGRLFVRIGSCSIDVLESELAQHPSLPNHVGRSVVVGVRPERLGVRVATTASDRVLGGTVVVREALGSDVLVHFHLPDDVAEMSGETSRLAHDTNDPTEIEDLDRRTTFVARLEPGAPVKEGEPIEVELADPALSFFDQEAGHVLS